MQDIDWSKFSLSAILTHGPLALKAKPTSLAAQMQSARASIESANAVTVARFVNGVQVSSSLRPPLGSLGSVYRDFYTIWGRSLASERSHQESTSRLIVRLVRAALFRRDQSTTRDLAKSLYSRHKRLIGFVAI